MTKTERKLTELFLLRANISSQPISTENTKRFEDSICCIWVILKIPLLLLHMHIVVLYSVMSVGSPECGQSCNGCIQHGLRCWRLVCYGADICKSATIFIWRSLIPCVLEVTVVKLWFVESGVHSIALIVTIRWDPDMRQPAEPVRYWIASTDTG